MCWKVGDQSTDGSTRLMVLSIKMNKQIENEDKKQSDLLRLTLCRDPVIDTWSKAKGSLGVGKDHICKHQERLIATAPIFIRNWYSLLENIRTVRSSDADSVEHILDLDTSAKISASPKRSGTERSIHPSKCADEPTDSQLAVQTIYSLQRMHWSILCLSASLWQGVLSLTDSKTVPFPSWMFRIAPRLCSIYKLGIDMRYKFLRMTEGDSRWPL